MTSSRELLPRPSDDPRDPLNWPLWLKISILIQVSSLAALGTFNTAVINPAYGPLAAEFNITTVTASYQTTVAIGINGIGPFIWIPFANVYGRRPIYLLTTLIGFATALACGFTNTFNQLIIARVFNGLFPVAMALGPATVNDLFFFHQRGRAMGVFTVALTSGAHFASLVGGPVGQFLGWRWCFKLTAIMNAVMLVIIFFALPETLYVRRHNELTLSATEREVRLAPTTYLSSLRLWSTYPELKLKLKHFIIPSFKMARYPSVIFPALYYSAQYSYAAILPAVTVATIFEERYHWGTLQTGLSYGGTFTIGSLVGEFAGGLVLDKIVASEARRLGRNPEPEVRLKAIWPGAFLVPAGLLIYGFSIQYPTPWFPALFGMFIAIFGLQIIATVCYTYPVDCYRHEGSEISQLINFIRQLTGMTVAFYVVRLCKAIGYQYGFIIFTILSSVLAFLPMLWLVKYGEATRKRIGSPKNVNVFDSVGMLGEEETVEADGIEKK
ncbi:hypothetical protein V501_03406 [Pseudogymnoascus sp. VKM F-4519 (FW-2642)]|nr:hypothetical protein V501_03406 [Pseudogymnoascus sp. VKM F-4519 (FW-2642)]